jgi:23S rRNA (uridine2552-2'-O)-methyltransferase
VRRTLEEVVERDRLLKPGMVVVDLGATPGGWSQWVRQELDQMERGLPDGARRGRVIASDILEMPSLAGVEFLHGDFRDDAVLSSLLGMLGGEQVDLVLSDMAPNKSGMDSVDQPRAMHLAELAMEFADGHLRTIVPSTSCWLRLPAVADSLPSEITCRFCTLANPVTSACVKPAAK